MVPFQRYSDGRMLRKVSLRLISASAHLETQAQVSSLDRWLSSLLLRAVPSQGLAVFLVLELVWFTLLVNVKFGEQNLGVSPLLTNKP